MVNTESVYTLSVNTFNTESVYTVNTESVYTLSVNTVNTESIYTVNRLHNLIIIYKMNKFEMNDKKIHWNQFSPLKQKYH